MHIAISSCHHIIISHHHFIIPFNQPKSASRFWPKSQEQNRWLTFYPFTKSHRELNFGTSGVIFRDELHDDTQKFTAPPNHHIIAPSHYRLIISSYHITVSSHHHRHDDAMINCWYMMMWWNDVMAVWWYDDVVIWWYDDMMVWW